MSMLVSDYDGTFKGSVTSNLELSLNIKAVKEYMKKGNTFVIATGRPYISIKKEIDFYDIPYDYLICNDGSTIFDRNNLIHSNHLNDDITKELISIIEDMKIEYSLYNHIGKTRSIKDIVEIALLVKNMENYKKMKDTISDFNDLCIDKLYRNAFIRKNCHKDYGIDVLCNIIGNIDNIYTIGNDKNDIEMLKKYDGYKVLLSYLHDNSIKTVSTVSTLVKKII